MAHFIHIAGSKGKGGTAHLISCALEVHGARVGLFSSPHILEERECIRIQREPIEKKRFEALEREFAAKYPDLSPFERLTKMAYQVFADERCDYWLVECGLGGSRDATEWFAPKEKALCILTHIELEHTAILGDRLEEITVEKLGISRPEVPLLTPATQKQEVLNVLKTRKDLKIHYVSSEQYLEIISSEHPESIALASEALKYLSVPLSPEILKAWEDIQIPGHFELMQIENAHLILDGAHTRDSLEFLIQRVRKFQETHQLPELEYAFHILSDKPKDLSQFFPKDRSFWISIEDERAGEAPEGFQVSDVDHFLAGLKTRRKPSLILLTGSFRLLAAFKKALK